jgi:glycosyltransferase involved in cell wall biosynthesis
MEYHIISVGHNCGAYIDSFAGSISKQGSFNVTVHICDDCSTDDTWHRLQSLPRTTYEVTRNANRMGAAYTRYQLIQAVKNPNAIILLVDLDDELLPGALKAVDNLYSNDPKTWATYGNWVNQFGRQNPNISYPEVVHIDSSFNGIINKGIIRLRNLKRILFDRFLPPELRDKNRYIFYPDFVAKNRSYRQYPSFLFTHLRTFKRFLFDKLDESDFQDEEGNWFMYGTDTPLLGILEQCDEKNIRCVKKPLYLYRESLHQENEQKKRDVFEAVRRKKVIQ